VFALVSLGDIADVSQIVGLIVAVPVIVLAWRQLVSGTAASEAQPVLALDEAFSQFEDLRDKLRAASKEKPYRAVQPADRARLSRYLAVFERLGMLVTKRLIDQRRGGDLYGYALARLLTRSNAEEIVCSEIGEAQKEPAHSERRWENLIRLWEQLPGQPEVPKDIAEANRDGITGSVTRALRTWAGLKGR
jgi:hypothetical protein